MDILHAIVNGTSDSEELSELAKGLARNKISKLKRALKGRIT